MGNDSASCLSPHKQHVLYTTVKADTMYPLTFSISSVDQLSHSATDQMLVC